MTVAPSARKWIATIRPTPSLAPVTTTTRSAYFTSHPPTCSGTFDSGSAPVHSEGRRTRVFQRRVDVTPTCGATGRGGSRQTVQYVVAQGLARLVSVHVQKGG